MVKRCFVPYCKSGRKSDSKNELKFSLFKAPNDLFLLNKWRQSVPLKDRELNSQDRICEKHFEKHYIIPRWQPSRMGDFYIDHIRPKLTPNAVPTIFPDVDPKGYPLRFKALPVGIETNSLHKSVELNLLEVEVNENDFVPVCYKCLIKKCSSHIGDPN